MITPAISVLSAIEGVKVARPSLSDLVVPITATIIVVLFLVQHLGTRAVGRLFGPVMAVWFAVIGVLGVRGIASAIRSPFFLLAPNWAQLPMVFLASCDTVTPTASSRTNVVTSAALRIVNRW
jgi:K+ transporter